MLRRYKWFVLIGGVIALILLTISGVFHPLSNFLRGATLPIVRLFSGSTEYVVTGINRASDGEARIEELEARVRGLQVDYVRLRALEEENKGLRAQAGFLEDSGYDSVGARVIGREIKDQRAFLLIDRGRNDHVELGQAVITDDGLFIGKIDQVQEHVSVVTLLTDSESRVAGKLIDQNQLVGIIEGRGNGTAALTFIPNNAGVEKDAIVVTAGTESKVPPNLVIGVINKLEGEETDPFLTASLEPYVLLDRIQFVSILRPSVLRPRL